MTMVQPVAGRATVSDNPSGIQISIPAKRNVFIVLFMSYWLVGWAVGEVMVPSVFLRKEMPPSMMIFTLAWLGAWTVGGGFAIYMLLWMIFGREIVSLGSRSLGLKRDVLGFGRLKEYDVSHIHNLRVSSGSWNPFDFTSALQFWGIGGGMIAFDYGSKTCRFGTSLEEAEANQLVQQLKSRVNFN